MSSLNCFCNRKAHAMRAGHCLSSPFRCKSLQHLSVYFVILVMSIISLVLIYKRSVGHGYDEFSQREKRTNLYARMPARFFNNNRNKYNLMDEASSSGGLGKLKQFFNIYDKACTLGDYIPHTYSKHKCYSFGFIKPTLLILVMVCKQITSTQTNWPKITLASLKLFENTI